jgi:uncharacterized membrane protein (UPF0127 family)
MLRNLTRQTTIATHLEITENSWDRMKGLLGRNDLPAGHGLMITHCRSIHMFFMKFPIDVIFCNDENKVVGLCPGIKPFALSPVFFQSACAIELPVGTIHSSRTQVGDNLAISTVDAK